jgi:hypothetical protein
MGEGADAVFFALGNIILEAILLLEPKRVLLGPFKIETTGVPELLQRDPPVVFPNSFLATRLGFSSGEATFPSVRKHYASFRL